MRVGAPKFSAGRRDRDLDEGPLPLLPHGGEVAEILALPVAAFAEEMTEFLRTREIIETRAFVRSS